MVIQSYLRRSLRDVRALAPLTPNVRLVKGIYVEPKAIAYTDPGIIQRNFVELLEELVAAGSYVAVATHDQVLVDEALQGGRPPSSGSLRLRVPDAFGRCRADAHRSRQAGHRVRVYVPYGTAWYGYAMRRLRENPAIAGYVARDVLRAPWSVFSVSDG